MKAKDSISVGFWSLVTCIASGTGASGDHRSRGPTNLKGRRFDAGVNGDLTKQLSFCPSHEIANDKLSGKEISE